MNGRGPADASGTAPVPEDPPESWCHAPMDAGAQDALERAAKVPRRLHVWFSLAVGVLATAALAVQMTWQHAPAGHAVAAGPAAAGHDGEPPLVRLQSELAREKGQTVTHARVPLAALQSSAGRIPVLPATGAAGQAARPSGIGTAAQAALTTWSGLAADAAEAPPGSPAAQSGRMEPDPGPLFPDALLDNPVGSTAPAQAPERAQTLIAGSRILALGHAASPVVAAFGSEAALPLRPGNRDPVHTLADLLQTAPELLARLPAAVAAAVQPAAGSRGAPDAAAEPPSAAAGGLQQGPLRAHAASSSPLIQEGTPIPCLLLTEVRSDLPGMIVAQVAEDVFDSVTAQLRLIPRGTRLIGRYENQIAQGQQRLFAMFHRMILPGGASVDLPGMQAGDSAGGAGLHDQIDTHFWQRFGQAFLTAGLARAVQRDAAATSLGTPGGVLPGPDASGQILVETARGSLQSMAGLAPTLLIRRGTRFNVMVSRDLALPEFAGP